MVLTRQTVPALRTMHTKGNSCALGGYVLAEAGGARQVSLLATGSEVYVAMNARELLAQDGIAAAVISIPCWELFDEQEITYRESVLGEGTPRVAVEAAVRLGWERYTGPIGAFIGMDTKIIGQARTKIYKELYEHFGITAQAVADAARKLI